MANIKVKDLTDTTSITTDNQVMILTDDVRNQVQNITVGSLLTNVISSDADNVLEQGIDNKLYVQNPEIITGDLEDLTTVDKYTLVGAINELNSDIDNLTDNIIGDLEDLNTSSNYSVVDAINSEVADREAEDIDIQNDYNSKIGSLSNLDTTDKSSLVNAINELSNILDPTQTTDYINNSKGLLSGEVSTNSTILSDVKSYAHSTFDIDKFSKNGTPTVTADGIVSGFNSTTRIYKEVNYTDKNSVKVIGRIVYKTNGSAEQVYLQLASSSAPTNTINSYIVLTDTQCKADITINGTYQRLFAENFSSTLQDNDIIDIEYYLTESTQEYKIKVNGVLDISKSLTTTLSPFKVTNIIPATANNNNVSAIDIKYFSVIIEGVPVFSGNITGTDSYTINGSTVTIPYALSKTGSKIVDSYYRTQVSAVYNELGYAPYYTLSDTDFTLPMGELYGMLGRLQQLAENEIGIPVPTLSNTLNDNEIWLEGAEVSKSTYAKLYAIYGDSYGTPVDSLNFVLPNLVDKVMQGIASGTSFGYIAAGLPNITGTVRLYNYWGSQGTSTDAFYNSTGTLNSSDDHKTEDNAVTGIYFDASRSNSIYGNSNTVQPPAIKVRYKTRYI